MEHVTEEAECVFCHSSELELLYNKTRGLLVRCEECGFSCVASNVHIDSDTIKVLAS